MQTVEQLAKTVTHLRHSIDCLLIRVDSCEQFIEKLMKLVGDMSRGSSCEEILGGERPGPGERDKGALRMEKKESWASGRKEVTSASMRDFMVLPSSKDVRVKQVDTGSATLLKNAVLVNCYEIEKLEQSLEQSKTQSASKFDKINQAINLLTHVVNILQQKIDNNLSLLTGRSNQEPSHQFSSRKKDRSRQSPKKQPKSFHNCIDSI